MMRGDEEELLDPSKVVQQEVGVESRVDQIYEVEIANLQGHLQEILSREFLRTIRWYMTSCMTS
jgi:hypothetical protein